MLNRWSRQIVLALAMLFVVSGYNTASAAAEKPAAEAAAAADRAIADVSGVWIVKPVTGSIPELDYSKLHLRQKGTSISGTQEIPGGIVIPVTGVIRGSKVELTFTYTSDRAFFLFCSQCVMVIDRRATARAMLDLDASGNVMEGAYHNFYLRLFYTPDDLEANAFSAGTAEAAKNVPPRPIRLVRTREQL